MKKSEKRLPEIYDTLDMPVYYWEKVHQTNDLSWLLVKRTLKINKKLLAFLQKTWEKIYEQYISEFGFSEAFKNIKDKEKEIALLKCELIITGERINETYIEMATRELEAMKNRIGKGNFMQTKMAIEKFMGTYLPLKEISVREFFSYLKHLK